MSFLTPRPAHLSSSRSAWAQPGARFFFPALFALSALTGQTQPTPTPTPLSTSEGASSVVTLGAFEVNTDKDNGFVAATSLAGGRLASDIKDTPVAYSVQTREFLDALNLTNLNDAQEWTVNTYAFTDNETGGVALGVEGAATTRGVTANPAQRNFFPGNYNFDTYDIERLDYTRGPNSILFGAGTISGTANAMSKFGRIGRNHTDVGTQFDSYGSVRATLDANRSFGQKVAVRLNALWDNKETWRDGELIKKKAVAPAVTYAPFRNSELKVSGEYYEKSEVSSTNAVRDQVSGWDGVTTYGALESLAGSSTDTTKYVSHGVNRFGSSTAPEYWMWAPDGGRLMNYAGTVTTVGYSGATNRAINGKVPLAGSLNVSTQPILDSILLPGTQDDFFGPSVRGSKFRIPSREFTNLPTVPIGTDRYKDLVASFTQKITDSLVLEIAGDINERRNYGNASYYWNNSTLDGFGQVHIDVNRLLPNGETNPYYLDPYMIARMDQRYNTTKNKAGRLALGYVKSWGWMDLRFNAMGGKEKQDSFTTRETGVLPIDPDSRQWGRLGTQSRLLHFQLYYDQPNRGAPRMDQPLTAIDPQTGVTRTLTPVWALALSRSEGGVIQQIRDTDYGQAAAQLSFFKKRFTLLAAGREDQLASTQKMGLRALSYPTGFVPTRANFLWRPTAPSDYYNLSYVPKDATGKATATATTAASRPLDANGVPLAQYAGDRFQNDYNPPSVKNRASTKSVGGILKLYGGFSLWSNFAQTFNPGNLGLVTINYETPPPSTSKGIDVGLRYVFGDGRFMANVSHYKSTEKNFSAGNPPGFSNFNPLISTNAIGDDSAGGTNQRGLNLLPDQWNDKSDREAKGYEVEIVANLTPNWRLTANFGTANSIQNGAYRDTRAWLASHDTVLRQILADAGVVVNSSGVASVPANTTVSVDATTAANAWNAIQTQAASWVSDKQTLLRMVKYTTNFYTDYKFTRGWMRGLRLGGGLQYRGPQVIGYRGADQIPDPTAPTTRAIDDPAVSAYTAIWARSYGTATVSVAYALRVFHNSPINLNLTVRNVFNYDMPLYNSVGTRPYGADLASPARVSVPLAYTYVTPRTFTLSASYGF